MSVSSAGGYPFVDEADIPTASICDNYVWFSGLNGFTNSQVQKILTDKNFGANWGMHRWGEYYNANGSNKDFEVALQLLYLFFENPQFTDDGWNYVYQSYENAAKNFGASVNDVINTETKKFFYDNSSYYIINDKNFVASLDKAKAEKIFRDRFSNIADFKFVFVGDFNEKQLLELCRSYIGSIPGDKDKIEECKFVYFSLPEGIKTNAAKKGSEPQASVRLMFRGNLAPAADVNESFLDKQLAAQMAEALETRLHEVIREDESGTYGIGVSSSFDGYPARQYSFVVEFGCAPDRVLELRDKVIAVIEDVKANGLDKSYTDNLAEIYRRNLETNLRDNGWWLDRIKSVYYDTTEPESVITDMQKKIPGMITPEAVQALAIKYLDTQNYFFGYILPEK
jgi:zinc protease